MGTMVELEGVERIGAGKVRELYAVGNDILLVATDRISAFDVVLPTPIPDKGRVLTALTRFWCTQLADVVGTALISTDVDTFPPVLAPHAETLRGRAMLCRRAQVLPIECIVRGYLSGSGWKSYQASQSVCGIELPPGLTESAQLPEPIFTPSTKAAVGHDENISFAQAVDLVGREHAETVRDISLALYARAAEFAHRHGLLVADTKFEFGLVDGRLLLVDEVLTPDSSRFWPADGYRPGRAQPSFDKQYVRDWLEAAGWDKRPPAPELPADVVAATRRRYLEAHERLTGEAAA